MNLSARPRRSAAASRLLGTLLSALLRLQFHSWRVEYSGRERIDALHARGERILLAFWHGGYIPLFALLRGHEATILTSDSFRGRVIADICRRFGYRGLIIPADHQGSTLDFLNTALAYSKAVALAVDGPLGPRHAVKTGAIRLASSLGFTVVPAAAAGRRHWVAERRWDRMEIPYPFTRVALVLGEPIRIPAGIAHDEVRAWQTTIHAALEQVQDSAHRQAAMEEARHA